jgi:hypothetical protein
MAEVLRRAEVIARGDDQQWAARHEEMEEAGEYAIVRPYRSLSGAEELSALTDAYWAAAEADEWGAKLDRYLGEAVAHEMARRQ